MPGRGESTTSARRLLARQRAELAVRLRIQGLTLEQIAAYPGSDGQPLFPCRQRADDAIKSLMVIGRTLPEGEVPPGAPRMSKPGRLTHQEWLVYYMRVGNRCKIGVTSNLERRLQQLTPEELLGTEPGDRHLERQRHLEFSALWVANEWYRLEGELAAFVATLDPRTRQRPVIPSAGPDPAGRRRKAPVVEWRTG